jgi:hypothetical protein
MCFCDESRFVGAKFDHNKGVGDLWRHKVVPLGLRRMLKSLHNATPIPAHKLSLFTTSAATVKELSYRAQTY